MKKISLFSILIIFLVLVLTNACEKDEFTELDAINLINNNALVADSISTAVYFTVKVVDASTDFSFKSGSDAKDVSGLAGATVTVKSQGDSATATTGADGSATFSDLRIGSYSVRIEASGFTSVDFTAEASSNGYYSVEIPVLATTGSLMTVTGTVRYETNLLNTSKELASGVTVLADPDIDNFFNSPDGVSNFSYSGFTNTFTTDASGVYTATLPAAMAGNLTYDISIPTFEANQSLLLNTLNGADVTGSGNEAQSIATRFGTSMTIATAVPNVNPVYCVFGTPDHTFTAATLAVTIDDFRTVNSAYVTNVGYGYAAARVTVASSTTSGADAVFQINTDDQVAGKIEYITVINAGTDITATTIDLSFEQMTPDFEVTVVVGGVITDIAPIASGAYDGRGRYLLNDASLLSYTISSVGGSGAVISIDNADFGATTNEGYSLSGLGSGDVTNGGTGYAVGDAINITLNTTGLSVGAASIIMNEGGVSTVEVDDPGTGYPFSDNFPVLFSTGDAVATAYTNSYGQVVRVDVTTPGTKNTAIPTASVDYDLTNKTATADVFVQDGEVQSVFNLDGGKGYDVVPALNFFSQYAAGNPAVTVDAAVTINAGSPYAVNTVFVNSSDTGIAQNMATTGGAVVFNLKSVPGGNEYHDFYLGTGVRTEGE